MSDFKKIATHFEFIVRQLDLSTSNLSSPFFSSMNVRFNRVSVLLLLFFFASRAECLSLRAIEHALPSHSQIKILTPCELEHLENAICVATVKAGPGNPDATFHLLVPKGKSDAQEIYHYAEKGVAGPLAIDWLDAHFLSTRWATGSALHFDLFRWDGKSLSPVLSGGSKFSPEFVWQQESAPTVLISQGGWLVDKNGDHVFKPVVTDIYEFHDNAFKKIKTVPYADRFKAE